MALRRRFRPVFLKHAPRGMARFAKPLQGSFSPVAKHPQKHKNRPEIGRFSHFNPSAEMHPFSLFSASKAPEKWLCDAICRKKQLFPTSRSGFLILHECLQALFAAPVLQCIATAGSSASSLATLNMEYASCPEEGKTVYLGAVAVVSNLMGYMATLAASGIQSTLEQARHIRIRSWHTAEWT